MMGATPILSVPVEILHRIFQRCDTFADLVALGTSCKAIHEVWLSESSDLIWKLAPASILAFDSALMAVRATHIVADAKSHGIEPPHPFPVEALSGHVKKPTLPEMNSVVALEHLVKCIEWMMYHWNITEEPESRLNYEYPLKMVENGPWTSPPARDLWRERLHRGIYNVFLAGAVCSGPYNAPFIKAEKEGRADFLQRAASCTMYSQNLIDDDIAYLRTFPVYNFSASGESDSRQWKEQEYESIFGPLAEWVISDGASRGEEENLEEISIPQDTQYEDDEDATPGSFDGSEAGSIREIKTLLGAYEHAHRKISRRDYSDGQTGVADFRGQKTVTVVDFGRFQLEELSMPTNIEESENGYIFAETSVGFPFPRTIDIRAILDQVAATDSSSEGDYPPPPPEFEMFSFILRQYFDLSLRANTFQGEFGYDIYVEDLSSGDIFQVPNATSFSGAPLVMYQDPAQFEEELEPFDT